MKIALDAMGGDNAPGVTVEGALQAVGEYDDISVELIGNSDVLWKRLKAEKNYDNKRITVKHASEVVGMDEATSQALRKKKDSSIRVAVDMVKKGEAEAVVSAGHSGVAMATALTILKKAQGVDRPAIAVLMPMVKGRFLLIDAGANVDCKPDNLLQFALMGSAYYKAVYGVNEPKVGLMSIGEEDTKGNELTKEVFKLLKTANINFIGNIEGKDVFTGLADVVVCDGFIGNTILKVSEGLADALMKMLKAEISGSFSSKLGYLLMKPAIRGFRRRTDYDESGGAPLLGINGTCIICHGRSTSKAIKNALKVANQLAKVNINKIISEEIAMSHKQMKEQQIAEG
ncbi:phosphate acyltransferase PlsX [Candidatus Magnetominusculus dajiuhuensis]|uniref:phosphate acyltransferase PlsX n=1 Tax=Candidatus Magnetominusculus dajiuhuensis TaxID=3137712 RepID=UPI003B42D905